jgi:hypothetical protein
MTWSETYVRYTWPDQSRMYDINDLIRDVCTIYIYALIRSFISYIRLWSGDVYRTYGSDQIIYIVHMSLIRSFISYIRLWSGHAYGTMYDINDLIRAYVRYTSPDQRRMYDINDLVRAVCTIYITWSETYVRHKWPDQSRMYQVMYIVHTSLIRSFISYIRLWSGHLYRTHVSDQVIYIVQTSLIRL